MFGHGRIGPGDQDRPLCVLCARRPYLLPVDNPVVTVTDSAGGHTGQVGPRARFAEQLAIDVFASEQRAQEVSPLLLATERRDGRCGHAHPDAVAGAAATRWRTRRGQRVLDLGLKIAGQVKPAGSDRKVHPGESGVEPRRKEFVRVGMRRVVLVEQRLYPRL